jgi:hypothetical protein
MTGRGAFSALLGGLAKPGRAWTCFRYRSWSALSAMSMTGSPGRRPYVFSITRSYWQIADTSPFAVGCAAKKHKRLVILTAPHLQENQTS